MKQTIYKRVLAIICVLVLFAQVVNIAVDYHQEKLKAQAEGLDTEEAGKLTLWYTDEKLNSYLVEAAEEFQKEHHAEITLQLVTAVDYIEHINTASISDLGGPDLFITSSELLEKARLAGLAVENDSFSQRELEDSFPQKAQDAATCGGKLMAYPFYFETCFLLYNKNYTDTVPATIDDILAYSDSFEGGEGTEKVETIFKWNVADIFYNFFFISNYVDLGGATGDKKEDVDLSAGEIIECLEYYQSLNEFFAIDADAVTTDSVLQEFMDGKIVYTIAKTDAIARLDETIAGTYGIAEVPNLTAELGTRGLSVTNSVVVNAYSQERELAKDFAKYLTYEKVDDLYTMANKMPVKLGVEYENEQIQILLSQYENSLEVPKITDLSNYWIEMEIAFANIWRGNDVRDAIAAVNSTVQKQLYAGE